MLVKAGRLKRTGIWLLVFVMALTLVYVQSAGAVSTKIALTTSMVVNESGLGDATMLVDEQTTAGDPRGGSGGAPTAAWHPGWSAGSYPASAYINLGQPYDLTDVYLRDVNDAGSFTVSAGSPGAWTTLFTDGLTGYNTWKAHTVSVTTQYIRVTMANQSANVSEIVLYGSPSSSDTTAPAAVTDLSAGSATASSVALSWTAPGDDGSSGTATSYDVRYSLSTITAGNWASATQATGEPTPSAAGSAQKFTVGGLSAATTYYFALKTSDEASNESALSNVVSLTTSSGGSGKITLNAGMLTNDSGKGDASLLVDEQTTAGDPKGGSGGAPSSTWFPGWGTTDHPASVTVDLGQSYALTDIYLRDVNATGNFIVETGTPGSWTTQFTDGLTGYNTWNAHSVSVTTRYLRVTRASQGANMAELVVYGAPTGGGGGDTTAPAAITNLAAGTATTSSIALSWTAPGDDGNTGTAAAYDIRYSTSAITSGNWASATQATGEPSPGAAGTSQNFTLTGLSANTTYFIAIKTSDEVSNESALSNVVSKTTATGGGGSGGLITLDASMFLNESQVGDVTLLIDEGVADPKNGAGGSPTTGWFLGYHSIYYPGSVVIDLGTDYALTDIYLYDSSSSGNVVVSTGTPFSWTQQFTDSMTSYNTWKAHPVSTTTRYVQITLPNGNIQLNGIALYGTALGTPAAPPSPTGHAKPTMDQLIGINAFIDDPFDKMQVAGFVREYHNWNWDEGDLYNFGTIQTGYSNYPNNADKFNPSYAGGGSWNFDAYYSGLKALGITVAPAIQGSVSWLSTNQNYKPVSAGESALAPASYAEHADHMFQFAARYGSTAVADNKLKLAAGQPRSTGLNTLKYFENWNEQDKWWRDREGYFTPYEYAAMSSADYDGHQGAMGNTVGVKNADPNAKMVMGGLADPKLEYVRALKFWSDFNRGGSFPWDVINIHHYSNNGTNQTSGSAGISPEADDLKGKLQKFVDYRDRYLPGKEVWITEFGYDTNQGSPQKVSAIGTMSVEEVQANWIVRSYLAAAAASIDKAAMYMLRDVNANSSQQFDSSGLTGSQSTGHAPKVSWYYVYTLKNRLTGMQYVGEQASGDPNVKIYKFKNATTGAGAYVVWSPTSNDTKVNGYSLSLQGSPTSATLVTMASGDTDGVPSSLSISGGAVTVNVSERPLFVLTNTIQ